MKKVFNYAINTGVVLFIGLTLLFLGHHVQWLLANDVYLLVVFVCCAIIWILMYFYNKRTIKRYLIPMRLEDVIRLICALALDSTDFKTEKSVNEALRGTHFSNHLA